jgi:hypothetical protein
MAGDIPRTVQTQIDLAVMALKCDLTRVVTLQWNHAAGNLDFKWLGIGRSHHQISHDADTNLASQDQLVQINTWYARQLAYLLARLDETPEGSGTMLDNTLVFWCNELDKGNRHSHTDMPYLLAGGKNLGLQTGRVLRYGSVPHNNLLVSMMNLLGVPGSTFGDPSFCTGPLGGL